MNNMVVKEIINPILNLSISSDQPLSLEMVLEKLPPGWRPLYENFFRAAQALDGKVRKVYIYKGVLHVDVETTDERWRQPLTWMSYGLAKESSMQCMVDPSARGYRRKGYDGWPCLSWPMLIMYANEMDERES